MGAENVFLDVDNIQPGSDFVQVLTESVGACERARGGHRKAVDHRREQPASSR